MTKAQLDQYRRLLLELSSDARDHLTDMTEQVRQPTGGQADGGLSNAPMHLGDLGTEAFIQELNSTLMEAEQDLSSDISNALRRIDDGTFGICEGCGKPIPEARLQVLPYTPYCTKCSETTVSAGRANLNVGRPQRPQDTLAASGAQDVEPKEQRDAAGRMPAEHSVPDSAVGTAGGGTVIGGLAGTNSGHGDPIDSELERATASGNFNPESDEISPGYSGSAGGAVGGTPAGKRATGGRTADAK